MSDPKTIMARAIEDNSGDIYWNCEAGRHPNIYNDTAQAALQALEAAGWVVVPVDPTPEMLGAADNYLDNYIIIPEDFYKAMIDARPKQ